MSPHFTLLLVLFVVLLLPLASSRLFHRGHAPFACDPSLPETATYGFCRADLATPVRVRDLIGRLTLAEKVGLLGDRARAVHRLGIRPYEWWSEALHGVSNVGPGTTFEGKKFPAATSFPQVITTAASFNASLWEAIGRVVSDEARAMYNAGLAGLTYWSPNVNIFRDPRWGRGQETPGEDPVVAARYGASYVRGLQGDLSGDRLKVAACCKHYTAYDLDNWGGTDRFHFNALITKQDRVDTFDVPFRACVMEGNVASVMCSYNQVNGVPTCADPNFLQKTIRSEWRLNGYIVSDCDSVKVFYEDQHYTSTPEQAAADAIKAGLDLDCGPFLVAHTANAVAQNLLLESDVDKALTNTLTVQMRLGMFDPVHPYSHLGAQHVCSAEHQFLAYEAARQGIVLMKNHGPALPLSRIRHRTVALIGPNSDATLTMIGNYAGLACKYTSPLQGLSSSAKVLHQPGCTDVACETDALFPAAIQAAQQSDAVVLVMGLDQSIEAEFRDRTHLLLPGKQQDLINRVASAVPPGHPVILVLMSGGPIDITFAKNDPRIGAILWAGYPGQEGGMAIADIIYGTHNPSAKLPMTWYPQDYLTTPANLPMTAMAMRPTTPTYPGRTYRFYTGPTVYPFGHGLSYTNFEHSILDGPTKLAIPLDGRRLTNTTEAAATTSSSSGDGGFKAVRVTHARCGKLSLTVQVEVRNVGKFDGTQTLLVFSTPPKATRAKGWAPHRQLVAFERVHVPAGGRETVKVKIHVCKRLSLVDTNGVRRIPLGRHGIHVAGIKHAVTLHPAAAAA